MTDAQLEQLPELAQEIVELDRRIAAALCAPVHDFAELTRLRADRKALTRAAERRFVLGQRTSGPDAS